MKKTFLTLSVLALMAVSCNENNKKEEAQTAQTEMAEQKVETPSYVGTYTGVLPCADCDGNNITLTINEDSYSSKVALKTKVLFLSMLKQEYLL